MKFILAIFMLTISTATLAATDYKKDCLIAQKYVNDLNPTARVNMVEWVKAQAEEIGLVPFPVGSHGFAVEFGTRQYVLLVQGDIESCEVIGTMLTSLQKLKAQQPPIDGVVFLFGKPAPLKNVVILKEYNLKPEDAGKTAKLVAEWIKLDQDPRKTIDIKALTKPLYKSLGKIKKELRRIVDADEIGKLELEIQRVEYESSKWDISKVFTLKNKLFDIVDQKKMEVLSSKTLDFDNYVKMHDEVRRGLWDKANASMARLTTPSPKLKAAMDKGKGNIEGILKAIKADTIALENEIKRTFKESKEAVSESR